MNAAECQKRRYLPLIYLKMWEEAIGQYEGVNDAGLIFEKFILAAPGLSKENLEELIGRKIGILNTGENFRIREIGDD